METIEIWLKKHNITPDVLTDLFPGAILSYKEQARLHVPIGARIVYFHGLPRPHEVKGNYVEHIWKVGGGSIHDWHVQGNVDSDTLEKNVRHSLDLPCELLANQYMTPKDNRLLICGGGPSLEDHLMEISLLQKGGATVWALNNSFRYLCSKGIEPDAHVMLDARPENAEFIPFKTDALLLYSAQCHSDVFECGMKSGKVINWCPAIAPILDILREKKLKAGIVSIGSTVGLKALGLAHLFGFKNIDLYGYDSSYRNDKNHAYPQTLNDGEKIIDMRVSVDGHEKVFRCAPWMATQAEEFRQAIPNFLQEGVEITIHGDGLLPYIVTTMV